MAKHLLLECMTALAEVDLVEGYIKKDEDRARVHGLQSKGKIWINPVSPLVETIIHELLHEIKPEWSESTVIRFTTRLMREMTDDEILTVFRLYESRKTETHRKITSD